MRGRLWEQREAGALGIGLPPAGAEGGRDGDRTPSWVGELVQGRIQAGMPCGKGSSSYASGGLLTL